MSQKLPAVRGKDLVRALQKDRGLLKKILEEVGLSIDEFRKLL